MFLLVSTGIFVRINFYLTLNTDETEYTMMLSDGTDAFREQTLLRHQTNKPIRANLPPSATDFSWNPLPSPISPGGRDCRSRANVRPCGSGAFSIFFFWSVREKERRGENPSLLVSAREAAVVLPYIRGTLTPCSCAPKHKNTIFSFQIIWLEGSTQTASKNKQKNSWLSSQQG